MDEKEKRQKAQDSLLPAIAQLINEQKELLTIYNEMIAIQDRFNHSMMRTIASLNIISKKYKEATDVADGNKRENE